MSKSGSGAKGSTCSLTIYSRITVSCSGVMRISSAAATPVPARSRNPVMVGKSRIFIGRLPVEGMLTNETDDHTFHNAGRDIALTGAHPQKNHRVASVTVLHHFRGESFR